MRHLGRLLHGHHRDARRDGQRRNGDGDDADDNKVYSFEIDTRGRKRFLKVVFTIGNGSTGAFVVAVASLFRGHDTPRTAADAGDAIRMSV
jgi:hypothetical protein